MPSLPPVVRLLRELVARPSVNPSLLPDRPDLSGEERVAEFLADLARKRGLSVSRQAVLPGRRNLLVRLRPAGKVKRRILLAPHMDVVPAEEKQFTPRIRSNRLHGRGACDTKGSVAAFFQALLDLAADSPKARPAHTEIIFAGLVDEEWSQAGSRRLGERGPKADLAVAGEPTLLQVVTAHKGNLWIRLETRGRAAHGSTPQLGKNAVLPMARISETILTEYAEQLAGRSHPLLGSPTVNLGMISGGSQPNVVPPSCSVELDRRTLPGETETSVLAEIQALLKKRGLPRPAITESRGVPCPPLDTDPDLPLVRDFLRAANRRKSRGVPYFTDASPISMGGTPAIVFGPGDVAQAHVADEFLDVGQLARAHAIVLRFLREQP
ncbi:MAG: peptidase [Verrucomicrobiales bacterium]|nr:peptidase [Verrucomicrobiales bacterium]